MFVGYVIVVVGYAVIGVVLFGFVVVDDGVIADVGNSFVYLVDGGVLGVDVGKVGTVIYIDIAVPCVVVDGDIVVIGNLVGG